MPFSVMYLVMLFEKLFLKAILALLETCFGSSFGFFNTFVCFLKPSARGWFFLNVPFFLSSSGDIKTWKWESGKGSKNEGMGSGNL